MIAFFEMIGSYLNSLFNIQFPFPDVNLTIGQVMIAPTFILLLISVLRWIFHRED